MKHKTRRFLGCSFWERSSGWAGHTWSLGQARVLRNALAVLLLYSRSTLVLLVCYGHARSRMRASARRGEAPLVLRYTPQYYYHPTRARKDGIGCLCLLTKRANNPPPPPSLFEDQQHAPPLHMSPFISRTNTGWLFFQHPSLSPPALPAVHRRHALVVLLSPPLPLPRPSATTAAVPC